jgi:hypothetical protein
METNKKAMGLVLVYMSAMDIYDSVDSDIESTRQVASELNKLRELLVHIHKVSGDVLDLRRMTYSDIRLLAYADNYDGKTKALLRNIVKRLHIFIGTPGGPVSSMNVSKLSVLDVINRTSTFIVTAEKYLINRSNIERWNHDGGFSKATRSKEHLCN